MNANEGFEQFAKKFQAAFGYLPLGKDDPGRPCAENILADLCETWRRLRAAQPAAAAPSASANSRYATALDVWREYNMRARGFAFYEWLEFNEKKARLNSFNGANSA